MIHLSLAQEVVQLGQEYHIQTDHNMGLDHGAWAVLKYLYPKADVPVFQLSIDYTQPPSYHYELAGALGALRQKGVLIIGSKSTPPRLIGSLYARNSHKGRAN